jgi:hypothetical protein
MMRIKLIVDRLDKDMNLLEHREALSRSLTKNFINLLYIQTAATSFSLPDITNTSRTPDDSSSDDQRHKCNLKMSSAGGYGAEYCYGGYYGISSQPEKDTIRSEYIGIQVGTGTNAVTPTDYALQTRVAHGRSSGQLEYGGCEIVGISFSNPNGQFSVRRYFTNISGGAITINEAGIYAAGGANTTGSPGSWPFLIARDLVSPAVTVNDGEILRVTYMVQITV